MGLTEKQEEWTEELLRRRASAIRHTTTQLVEMMRSGKAITITTEATHPEDQIEVWGKEGFSRTFYIPAGPSD
jgi:invasion protein IalB